MSVRWYGEQCRARIEAHLKRNLAAACIFVWREARRNARAGGPSGFKTSHGGGATLVGSIAYEIEYPVGRIGAYNLRYARIHELGGVIRPVTKKFLHFWIDDKEIFTKVVHMPARPYLRPALDNNITHIRQLLGAPIRE